MKSKYSVSSFLVLSMIGLVLCLNTSLFSQEIKKSSPSSKQISSEEFVGPFPSWANLKRDYGAIGDGQADDTQALQAALNDLKQNGKPKVLYLPAGTYRITKGLTMISTKDVSILGEDPANTIIKWAGPSNGTMLDCNGVAYSRFGRITWDGAGKAATAVDHGWDGKIPYANSHGEHADEVFKDVSYGIKAGSRGFMDAECAVLRCHFERCSVAGISLHNFNAADWLIWYCTFKDCFWGVTNNKGAGYYSVNHSLFYNSKMADMGMYHCGYFSMRHNTSIGSKAFFVANGHNCAGLVTIQGNTILDPIDTAAIQVGNYGPCLLVDNIIRGRQVGPPIQIFLKETFLSVGNTFTSKDSIAYKQIESNPNTSIQDRVVAPDKIPGQIPKMPPTLPNRHRQIFEIPLGSKASSIQAIIDKAAKLRGKHPVVHFSSGNYTLDHTLTIPANADIQLVGDGYTTQLTWAGEEPGPILHFLGPSQAKLSELQVIGNGKVEGVVVDNCNQIGSRIYMQQASVKGNFKGEKGIGLLAEGLDHTDVSLHNFYHSGNKEVGVKVVGGPKMANGENVKGRVAIFGGASSSNTLCYDLTNNANLLAEDIWYEASSPRFLDFNENSSGTFTLNGSKAITGRADPGAKTAMALPEEADFAALKVKNFRGNITLVNVIIGTNILVKGNGKDTNFFGMLHGTNEYFNTQLDENHALLFGSTKYTPGGGAIPIANQGDPDPDFILKMLAHLRKEVPRPITPLKKRLTDMQVNRIIVMNCTVGLHLKSK